MIRVLNHNYNNNHNQILTFVARSLKNWLSCMFNAEVIASFALQCFMMMAIVHVYNFMVDHVNVSA